MTEWERIERGLSAVLLALTGVCTVAAGAALYRNDNWWFLTFATLASTCYLVRPVD